MAGDDRSSSTEEDQHRDVSDHKELMQSEHDRKTAFYNKASEKSLSHAEAKMIYRRHMLDTSEQEQQSPLRRVQTFSTMDNREFNVGKLRT